jgi:hypothetical protein
MRLEVAARVVYKAREKGGQRGLLVVFEIRILARLGDPTPTFFSQLFQNLLSYMVLKQFEYSRIHWAAFIG